MPKIYHIDLTSDERAYLCSIVKRRSSISSKSKRSQILLACDRNGDKKWSDSRVREEYKITLRTIERLRERFVNDGLSVALSGKPQPNLDKIVFDGEAEAKLVALRCSEDFEGRSSWTLRLLADKMVSLEYVDSISHETVRQILKKTKLSLGALPNG
jgi:hypothetical protein